MINRFGLAALMAVLMTTGAGLADEPPTMKLWPQGAPGETGDIGPEEVLPARDGELPVQRVSNVTEPTITVYRPDSQTNTGTAVVICPGGGYNILAWDKEGTEVAEWLNGLGVTGIVVKYRVPRRAEQPKHLAPLQDAQRSVSLVRQHAAEWGIDPQRIGILGFSAGGHLSATAATNWDQRQYAAVDAADEVSCRPDFAVLVYPAYLVEADKLSPEIRVTSDAPPTFFAHAGNDRIGPENSIALYLALKKAGVPAELHVYADGGHGFGLRDLKLPVSDWPQHCANWMKSRGLIGPEVHPPKTQAD